MQYHTPRPRSAYLSLEAEAGPCRPLTSAELSCSCISTELIFVTPCMFCAASDQISDENVLFTNPLSLLTAGKLHAAKERESLRRSHLLFGQSGQPKDSKSNPTLHLSLPVSLPI